VSVKCLLIIEGLFGCKCSMIRDLSILIVCPTYCLLQPLLPHWIR
jgi:hypothetical protein